MNPSIHAVADLLKLDTGLFQKGLVGLTDEQAGEPPADDANPVNWLAGHIASSRFYMLNALGGEDKPPWGALYSDGYDPAKTYPKMAEVRDVFDEITAKLMARLPEATEEDLNQPNEGFPTEDKTVRGTLVFWMYHEAWHIGQVAYAKKSLGLDGLLGY